MKKDKIIQTSISTERKMQAFPLESKTLSRHIVLELPVDYFQRNISMRNVLVANRSHQKSMEFGTRASISFWQIRMKSI